MAEGRWDRLAADLKAAGFDGKVDETTCPGGITRRIHFQVKGAGLVVIHDTWWRKNRDVWTGWQVWAEGTDSIVVREFRASKKRSETVTAFRAALAAIQVGLGARA